MFLRGWASDGEPTSGIFKLQKFCTDKNFVSGFSHNKTKYLMVSRTFCDKMVPIWKNK